MGEGGRVAEGALGNTPRAPPQGPGHTQPQNRAPSSPGQQWLLVPLVARTYNTLRQQEHGPPVADQAAGLRGAGWSQDYSSVSGTTPTPDLRLSPKPAHPPSLMSHLRLPKETSLPLTANTWDRPKPTMSPCTGCRAPRTAKSRCSGTPRSRHALPDLSASLGHHTVPGPPGQATVWEGSGNLRVEGPHAPAPRWGAGSSVAPASPRRSAASYTEPPANPAGTAGDASGRPSPGPHPDQAERPEAVALSRVPAAAPAPWGPRSSCRGCNTRGAKPPGPHTHPRAPSGPPHSARSLSAPRAEAGTAGARARAPPAQARGGSRGAFPNVELSWEWFWGRAREGDGRIAISPHPLRAPSAWRRPRLAGSASAPSRQAGRQALGARARAPPPGSAFAGLRFARRLRHSPPNLPAHSGCLLPVCAPRQSPSRTAAFLTPT